MELEPPKQLVCFEIRKTMEGGQTEPLLAACTDEDDAEHLVVLKLRQPVGRIGDGHFGGTSLAAELICSAIARAIGIDVPDYALVDVPAEVAAAQPKMDRCQLLERNLGQNFGSVYREGFVTWNADDAPRSVLLLDAVERVLAFDAAVFNFDRKAKKPNLLVRGDDTLAIDHSLALAVYKWDDDQRTSPPPYPEAELRRHCTFHSLERKGRPYSSGFENWRDRIKTEELARLRDWIPAAWETDTGDIDKIFDFLARRPSELDSVAAHIRQVLR